MSSISANDTLRKRNDESIYSVVIDRDSRSVVEYTRRELSQTISRMEIVLEVDMAALKLADHDGEDLSVIGSTIRTNQSTLQDLQSALRLMGA